MVDKVVALELPPATDPELVAARHDVKRRGRRQRRQDRGELLRRAEPVAASLNDEHRPVNRGQVRIASFRGAARRMKRIAEKDQTRDLFRQRVVLFE